jgi:hypothetical protein
LSVTVVSVQITTQRSSWELAQSEDDKQSIDITATVVPSDHVLHWSMSGDGTSFVDLISNDSAGTSTATVKLNAAPTTWGPMDSSVVLTVQDTSFTQCQASQTIQLIKFKREDGYSHLVVMSPGQLPVTVTLNTKGSIKYAYKNAFVIATSVLADNGFAPDDKEDKQDLKFSYVSSLDRGDGTYSIDQEIDYDLGDVSVTGSHLGSFHSATVSAAAAVSAGIDNDPVTTLTATQVGEGSTGSPTTANVGINPGGKIAGTSASIGVSLVLTGGTSFSAARKPTGDFHVKDSGSHTHLAPLDVKKIVRIAAGVTLTQTDARAPHNFFTLPLTDVWTMTGGASLRAVLPQLPFPTIVFKPNK